MDEIKKDYKKLARWSFCLGLSGLIIEILFVTTPIGPFIPIPILYLVGLSIPLAQIVGLFLGIIGIHSSRRKEAISGIVLSIIGLIITTIIVFIGVVIGCWANGYSYEFCHYLWPKAPRASSN